VDENGEYYIEPIDFYVVTEHFARKLEQNGEVVNEIMGFHIWGRTQFGQLIVADSIITTIANQMQILEGQRYDWSEKT